MDNITFCYSSEATLQGAVAMAYCDKGYERVGPKMVTCGSNGSWGELPRCLREPATSFGKNSVKVDWQHFSLDVCVGYLLMWNSALIAIGVVIWLIAAALDIVGLVVLIILAREKCMLQVNNNNNLKWLELHLSEMGKPYSGYGLRVWIWVWENHWLCYPGFTFTKLSCRGYITDYPQHRWFRCELLTSVHQDQKCDFLPSMFGKKNTWHYTFNSPWSQLIV